MIAFTSYKTHLLTWILERQCTRLINYFLFIFKPRLKTTILIKYEKGGCNIKT